MLKRFEANSRRNTGFPVFEPCNANVSLCVGLLRALPAIAGSVRVETKAVVDLAVASAPE